jgi:hypothetical protein
LINSTPAFSRAGDNERVTAEHISQGSLFSTDFLQESIARVADWQLLTDAEIDAMAADLRAILAAMR